MENKGRARQIWISGEFLDLVGFFVCPSPVFVVVGAGSSGGGLGRFVYFCPTFLGGFLFLLGVPSFGLMGVLADLVASGLCPSGKVMVGDHLQRSRRSTALWYANVIDMLFLVPIKNYVTLEWGSASSFGRLLRSPTTTMTRQFLQGPGCNFCFFQGHLCKIWSVNHINPV